MSDEPRWDWFAMVVGVFVGFCAGVIAAAAMFGALS